MFDNVPNPGAPLLPAPPPLPFRGTERTGRIVINSTWTILDNVVGLVCAVLSSVLVAKAFGPELLGHYSYIMWLILMTTLVGRTGIPIAAKRYFSQRLARNDLYGTRRLFKALLLAQTGVTAVTVTIALVTIIYTMPPAFLVVGVLGVIAIVPSVAMGLVTSLNSALETLAPNTKASVISTVMNLAGVVATIQFGLGLPGVIGSLVVSRFLDLALRIWLSRRALERVWFAERFSGGNSAPTEILDPAEKRELVRFVVQAVFLQFLGIIVWDRSEIFFLNHFSPIAQLAFYSIPFTMTTQAFLAQGAFASAATTSLFVVYAESQAAARNMLATIVKYMALIAFPLGMGLAAVSSPLLHILYGEKYLAAIPVLTIVAFFGPSRSFFIPAEQYLVVANRQDLLIYTTLGAAGVDLILCLTLIPAWGAVGAAWATSLAQIAAMILIWSFLSVKLRVPVPWRVEARIGLCGLSMFIVSWKLARIQPPMLGLIVAVAAGAIVYIALLGLTGAVNSADTHRLLSVRERVPARLRPSFEKLVRFITRTPLASKEDLPGTA